MAHEEIRTFVATGLRAALFASVLTLAACGSDSSSVDASALPEVTNPPATTTAPEPDNTTEKPPEDSVEGVTVSTSGSTIRSLASSSPRESATCSTCG